MCLLLLGTIGYSIRGVPRSHKVAITDEAMSLATTRGDCLSDLEVTRPDGWYYLHTALSGSH